MKNQIKIVLMDFVNSHGELIYNFLSKYTEVLWLDAKNLEISLLYCSKLKDKIICCPLAWEIDSETNKEYISNITKNNIMISSYDDKLLYPWSYNGVVPACSNIQLEIDNNIIMTGTSAYCTYLSILALYNPNYIIKRAN